MTTTVPDARSGRVPLKIVSGGQTGADQAGWRAARACGLPTGGWMPRGFETEAGPRPEFAELYGAVEHSGGYKARTEANARDSDGTIWFGDPTSPGGVATLRACDALGRPTLIVADSRTRSAEVADWIRAGGFQVLNVAGNRESKAPEIGERVERFLEAVFRRVLAFGGPRR